jgi:hypothetical protein
VHAVLRREHQDRRPVLGGAQLRADRVAVHPGQHDVEDDHVVGVLGGEPHPVAPVVGDVGDVDGEALARQTAGQHVGEPFLVLHQQQPHAEQSDDRD